MESSTADAMIEARDAALGTPEEIRRAWLAKRYSVPGLELAPWSISIMWVLEELQHPLFAKRPPLTGEDDQPILDAQGNPTFAPFSMNSRDLARIVYAFAEPERSYDALTHGVEVYDEEAMALMRSLPPSSVFAAMGVIPQIITEGLATLPGGANPPRPA